MKEIILPFLVILFLSSCGSTKTILVQPEYIEVIKPTLNQVAESEVGESLIEKETGNKYEGIEFLENIKYKSPSNPRPFEIEPGSIFIHTRQTKSQEIYTQEGKMYAIAVNRITGITTLVIDMYGIGKYTWTNKIIDSNKYKKILVPVTESNYLKQEFIYNGKIGTGVKFTYREFSDNLARAAFTQDLQYELSEGKIVGFKGLRIEIINAYNTKIEYKVLSYFNK